MRKHIVMSLATALVVSNVMAEDLKNVPMAKTYPMDTKAAEAPVVVKETVKVAVVEEAPAVDYDEKIEKLEKKIERLTKTLSEVKAHDAQDNIKFGVDFRTAHDTLNYKTASGAEYKNDSLFSNRLWLNMAFAPSDNMIFKGQLAYNKAYGAAPAGSNGFPQRGYGYDAFDWVINENLTDGNIKLKEAYWLYMSDSFLGTDVDWTASFGRRPSTNGFLINLRDDDAPASPLGHVINMEFDGASFKFGLEKVTGVSGMYWKLCLGRGLSNATARFNMDGGFDSYGDYTRNDTTLDDINLAGFIFVPYDDGQYKVMTTAYKGFDVPGFVMADANMLGGTTNDGMLALIDTDDNGIPDTMGVNSAMKMKNLGDMDGAALSVLVDGIGNGINDFLDDTKFFASFGWSQSHPNNDYAAVNTDALMAAIGGMMQQGMTQQQAIEAMVQNLPNMTQEQMAAFMTESGMMGSTDNEVGTSYWVGLQVPAVFTEEGRIGLEYNHGSKYWRPFTYGEDTLIGSKIATRGDAYEVYYTQPLMEAFTMQIRYTKINYDYTGSQGFFGGSGAPMTMDQARAFGMDPIEEADDLRISFRYRF